MAGLLDLQRRAVSDNDYPTRQVVLDVWERSAARVKNSRGVIALCRAVRRNEMVVTPPASWIAENPEAAIWCVPTLSERRTLDENMVATISGNEPPYAVRTPIASTDTGDEDADKLEVWANAVRDAKIPVATFEGLVVECGEFATLTVPNPASFMRQPSYQEDYDEDGEDGQPVRKRRPKAEYDRDAAGAPLRRRDGESAEQFAERRAQTRHEQKSYAAWSDEYLSWLATHMPLSVRAVNPLDCAPVVVQSSGADPYEVRGLVIRTLYDADDLLGLGFNWLGSDQPDHGMSRGKSAPPETGRRKRGADAVPALIPRAWGTDAVWGEGDQIYLYELYWMTPRGHAIGAFTVGGVETWMGEMPTDGPSMDRSVAVIDFTEEYALPVGEPLWSYHWGIQTQDDIDYRSRPWLAHFLADIANIESLRLALICETWEESFTGHYLKPDKELNSEAWMQKSGQFRQFKKPRPGRVEVFPGEVVPWRQTQAGRDAWTYLQYLHEQLRRNTPSAEQSGGESSGSGHKLVVQHSLLLTSKAQMRRAVLDACEFVLSRILMLAVALATKVPRDERLPWLPVMVTDEEMLPNGDIRERSEIVQLRERWVGTNYHLKFVYPEEGNLAEVAQAMDAADRGFGTDEDVYRAQGKRSTVRERVRIANYQWIMKNPVGQAELQMRAAKRRGDKLRQQLMQAVLAGKSAPDGTPMATVDPAMGGTAPGLPPAPGPGMGPASQLPNTAEASLNATVAGQVGQAVRSRDAMATAAIGG